MDTRRGMDYVNQSLLDGRLAEITHIQGWSDGGCRVQEGISSYGWLLKAWLGDEGPRILAAGGAFLDRAATSSMEVEAMGMRTLTAALHGILGGRWQTQHDAEKPNARKRRR
eukprot:513265-Lingulodinium_polyedra.AAC.1